MAAEMEPQIIKAASGTKKNIDIDPEVYREEIRLIIEKCVKFLVDQPETVDVTTYVGPKTTVYKINCARENMGQLIGSQGRTIMGLRAVVHAMTARAGIRSIVEIPV